jgi:hypothetical protein
MSGDALYALLSKEKQLQSANFVATLSPYDGTWSLCGGPFPAYGLLPRQGSESRNRRCLAGREGRTLNADSDVEWSGANSIDVKFQAQGNQSVLKQLDAGPVSDHDVGAQV